MLLELIDITKFFGGLGVLSNISFGIGEREIVGLIGPNGAGKTTLFNVITGIYRPNKGSIRFGGKDLVGLKPHQICRAGIARTFQLVRLFPTMTVLENVLVGAVYGRGGDKKKALEEALECLEILNLLEAKNTISAHLTLSDRRLVEMARAIAANLESAMLVGITPHRVNSVAFAIGIGLAGLAGVATATVYPFDPYFGFIFSLKAMIALALGGMGSVVGALLGGILLGGIESFSSYIFTGGWADAIAYAVFLLVLMFKPEGLFVRASNGD